MSYKHYGPRTRNGRGWLLGILIFLLVLILACVGVFLWAREQVGGPDRAAPGVHLFGEDITGYDRDQVLDRLRTKGFAPLAGKSLTLSLPGEELSVSAEELGLVPDMEAEADAILAWGRTGDRNRDALNWLLDRSRTADFPRTWTPVLQEEPLRELCRQAAEKLDKEPAGYIVFPDEEALQITLGSDGAHVDQEALLEELKTALERGELEVSCTPETIPAETPDLEAIWEGLHTEPVDAKFDDTYQVQPEKAGKTFDLEEGKKILAEAKEGETVRIPILTLEPEVKGEELEALLFRDLLASVDTPLTNNAVRTKNIEIAASMLNETILLPGQEFSYNGALGERTEEKGYGPATAYANGELVEEVGGGICQLSSALYYCCMLADEEILERTNHLYYQTYLPLGMDATVSWGGPDFRFKLKDEYPILIKAWIEGGQLKTEIWGTKSDDSYVELEYHVDYTVPHKTVYYEHKNVKSGKRVITDYGRDGMQVTTYRVRYNGDGTLIERVTEAVNVYSARDQVIVVAIGERPKK